MANTRGRNMSRRYSRTRCLRDRASRDRAVPELTLDEEERMTADQPSSRRGVSWGVQGHGVLGVEDLVDRHAGRAQDHAPFERPGEDRVPGAE
jgi:hypothetical protein